MKKKVSNSKLKIRKVRFFSEALKKKIVSDLEKGELSVPRMAKLYGVHFQTIYNWLYKYSPHHQKGIRQVVEMESEEKKRAKLEQQYADLLGKYGQKQLEVEYLTKLIEIASRELGVDIKKNFLTSASNGSKPEDPHRDTP